MPLMAILISRWTGAGMGQGPKLLRLMFKQFHSIATWLFLLPLYKLDDADPEPDMRNWKKKYNPKA